MQLKDDSAYLCLLADALTTLIILFISMIDPVEYLRVEYFAICTASQ